LVKYQLKADYSFLLYIKSLTNKAVKLLIVSSPGTIVVWWFCWKVSGGFRA